MSKRAVIILIIAAVAAAAVCGVLAYRRFVFDRIMDKGGMENPFCTLSDTENQGSSSQPQNTD